MMLLLREENVEVLPLHVNYGQDSEVEEWKACREVCKHLKLSPAVKVDLPGLRNVRKSISGSTRDKGSVFFPTRNLLLLTVAAAFAYARHDSMVAIGLISNAVFPDQTRNFIRMAERAINESLGENLKVTAPIIELDKRDILKVARKYALPIGKTYSCYVGKPRPCGSCPACAERLDAARALGKEQEYRVVGDDQTPRKPDVKSRRDLNG